jgi:pyruvate/2-oxoglutarate dehydrogenase complex dihydrolipoamide dehydrogenase (E3) component
VSATSEGIRLEGAGSAVVSDALLVATGRAANVERLGLETAGVVADSRGIQVDARMRTANPRIYASGDVASRYKFTHAADALSRIVIQNALFFGRKRADALVIPWCTFTDPEVAHVGANSDEAAAQDAATITVPLHEVDRAVVDDEQDGFVRIHHRGSRIVGATIVGPAAGETIALVAYAMRDGKSPADFSSLVFPYPTSGLALRQAGDAYRRAALTPGARRALGYYFRAVGAR